ncbi:MAG: hypothetical protein Q9165_006593 [Trypethelium subeluteriae]
MLYQTVRQMVMLRASDSGTLELLQAGLLVAYYACGHGLPRDAHMTLATCTALARLMGYDFEDMDEPVGLDKQHLICRRAIVLLDRTVALSSVNDPMPLALPLRAASNAGCLASFLNIGEPSRSFDLSSRVALVIGTALGYANDPRPTRLVGSTYEDTETQMESLVRELVCSSNKGSSAYTVHLALQIVSPNSETIQADSKEALLLQSTLRMVRDQIRATTYMMPEDKIDSMSVMALCNLTRAIAISIRLCGGELFQEELNELRFILQRFGARWTLGRKSAKDLYLNY